MHTFYISVSIPPYIFSKLNGLGVLGTFCGGSSLALFWPFDFSLLPPIIEWGGIWLPNVFARWFWCIEHQWIISGAEHRRKHVLYLITLSGLWSLIIGFFLGAA